MILEKDEVQTNRNRESTRILRNPSLQNTPKFKTKQTKNHY